MTLEPRAVGRRSDPAAGDRAFDLRGLVAADRAWKLPRLAYVLVILVSLGVALLGLLESAGGSSSPIGASSGTRLTDLAVTAGLVAVLGLGVTGIPRLRRGASALTIDDVGLHLVYSPSAHEDIGWSDRRGFVLRDLSASPTFARGDQAFRFHRASLWGRRTLLTQAAFESILREAELRAMERSEERGSVNRYGYVPITYRIRASGGS